MNSTARNIPYIVSVVVVYAFIVGTVLISFSHIVEVSHMLGLGWEAWTVPFLVDGIAIVGKLGRLDRFAEQTRKAGLWLMAFGGMLSLSANVAAGDNWGQRGYGVLLVVGFMLLEWYASKLKAAPAKTTRQLDPAEAKRRAAKAAATREANRLAKLSPAQKAAETRKRKAVAPVSPGMAPVAAPSVAEVAAAAA